MNRASRTFALAVATALIATASAMVLVAPAHAAPDDGTAAGGDWRFSALLDDRPIGEHRFTVRAADGEREVVSDASFDVRFLGISAYRYRHRATERWKGNCLAELKSSTDDDGKPNQVQLEQQGSAASVKTPAGVEAIGGCVMSFAYWNPALRSQTRLLNAQTGKLERVRIDRIGPAPIDVRGRSVEASGLRITGAAQPIDVWYSPQGDWIGLDSVVEGGRKLSYRLR